MTVQLLMQCHRPRASSLFFDVLGLHYRINHAVQPSLVRLATQLASSLELTQSVLHPLLAVEIVIVVLDRDFSQGGNELLGCHADCQSANMDRFRVSKSLKGRLCFSTFELEAVLRTGDLREQGLRTVCELEVERSVTVLRIVERFSFVDSDADVDRGHGGACANQWRIFSTAQQGLLTEEDVS